MARENVVKLFRAARNDAQLQDKLSRASDLATFVRIATSNGYEFTADEYRQATGFSVEELECELSEIPGI
ncbi:Nif11-like leader peptide family natural product precursor [Synechococcus sp. PCC 7336]|uniref:Nif11-like leader peptide family natural product precursor n=1 Tax=Synechococcus sp. PCC 7336 TaxID=195250 RepID=UPI00034D45C1|nr:Nif11-like leader peptide family natural product precursor [Synechococcus sp. PCC 7336]